MPEKKAYPGTISSIILSVIVVIILLVPFATANHLDKVRNGETKYEFKEVICFDIDSEEIFNEEFVASGVTPTYEPGAFFWRYYYPTQTRNRYIYQHVSISDVYLSGTVDGYARGFTKIIPGDVQGLNEDPTYVSFNFIFSKTYILDKDITRIDIYFDIIGATFPDIECFIGHSGWPVTALGSLGIVELGSLTSMSISVEDLLEINSKIPDNKKICVVFGWDESRSYIQGNQIVIFDMQWYNIEEFLVTTIDYMGIAMIGGGIFMGFCAILMLPQISFEWVMIKLVGRDNTK